METSKKDLYFSYLSNEGYRPEVDKDGDVIFKKEGNTFILFVDDKDETFFRLSLPNFWEIENDQERLKVLESCDYSNRRSKVAKVFIVEKNVWGNVELLLPNQTEFKTIFERSLAIIQNA